MRQFKRLSYLSFIGSMFFSQFTFAAAFQLYELGTPIIGTAAVGQAVVIDDASTAYLNPAGMGFLKSSAFMLGSQMMLPYANFSKNSSTTIRGDNGGNAGSLVPGMSLYYAYQYSPRLQVGISLASPYGGALDYHDGWVGRYIVQDVTFYTINLNPSISYRVNPWFSIGGGFSIEYMNLSETVALPLPDLIDGQVNVKMSNVSPGFNLGAMFSPNASTKIGIAYRSQIIHDLRGDLTFLRIATSPNVTSKMIMPATILASVSQDIGERWTVLGEIGWANWSSMRNTTLNVDQFSVVTPLNWNDTYRIGIAGRFKAACHLLLQAGASFDSSPTSTSHRLPVLPMDQQIRLGLGLIYTLRPAVKLGASYEYMNLGHADIHNTSSAGVLSGSYWRNFANTAQLSLNIDL